MNRSLSGMLGVAALFLAVTPLVSLPQSLPAVVPGGAQPDHPFAGTFNSSAAALAVAFTMTAAASAPVHITAGGRQQLVGHLTPEMLKAPVVGPLPPQEHLSLAIELGVNNMNGLAKMVDAISDPKSKTYRHYLTPDQFADKFGASPVDYGAVLTWARSNHLTATPHKNRLVASVAGSVADIEKALQVHLEYGLRADGTKFFRADREPSISVRVPIEHISGLDNFKPPTKAGGSGAGGSYQGSDFRDAYVPGVGLTGKGQKIGIFMADGFAQSDIDGYGTLTHETYLPVQEVPANTVTVPGEEGTLDVESALAMAPGAQIVAFVSRVDSTVLSDMSDRPDIKQLSSSWFWYDGTTTDEAVMMQLASQGQSFFQASGDGGAYPAGWPAASKYQSPNLDCRQFPDITIVGGTSLNMTGNGQSYGTLETAWSGSSGGILSSVPIPSYQTDLGGANGASSTNRNVPDVSAQAADALIFYNGSPTNTGGTSEATPLWAGFAALVNEEAARHHLGSLGFANPAIYDIGASPTQYAAGFHDVISGCAPNSTDNQHCAGASYDLVTGWGTPRANLVYELNGIAPPNNAKSFPFICRGPLAPIGQGPVAHPSPGHTQGSLGLPTPFKWSSEAASVRNPSKGECAFVDRGPSSADLTANDLLSPDLGTLPEVADGQYVEYGVYRSGSVMTVTQTVGPVQPPFSSSLSLPAMATAPPAPK